jgi:sucrose 6(F)-phosphate phosphorylase
LASLVQRQGGNVNRILSDVRAEGEVDVHQLNCTYYDALSEDDDRYIAARAIQLFARGVPQIYYVGLLAGGNDDQAVVESGDGRAINRHNYSTSEVGEALGRGVVKRVLDLIRLRSTNAAFGGRLEVIAPTESTVRMNWTLGSDFCGLEADLGSGQLTIKSRQDGLERDFAA